MSESESKITIGIRWKSKEVSPEELIKIYNELLEIFHKELTNISDKVSEKQFLYILEHFSTAILAAYLSGYCKEDRKKNAEKMAELALLVADKLIP